MNYPFPVLSCAVLTLALASPAAAQFGGTWNITAHSCCAYPDGTECEDSTLSFPVVTQTGNQLSGSTLDANDLPSECHDVTCTPTTPNCDQPVDLSGTVSGNALDITLQRVQSLHTVCTLGMTNCGVSLQVNSVAQAHGTVTGNTAAGSFDSQNNASCQVTGGAICQDAIACSNVPCIGTFAATFESCMGDCVGDGLVTVDELVMMVNVALGNMEVSECDVGDGNEDGLITVDEIVTAVNHALNGCLPTPAEQGCLTSGGTVTAAICCASTGDFPDTCAIGACGCSPDASHEVRVCACSAGNCFDGSGCVRR